WRTVDGGSINYVHKICDALGSRLVLNAGVDRVSRGDGCVVVHRTHAPSETFDHVILACHSDQSAALLDDTFAARKFLLGGVRYRPNTIYLHHDETLMPQRKSAWASWNVLKQDGEDLCLSYWMNKLQGIRDDRPLFVTLNPTHPPRSEKTFDKVTFDHPQFDAPAEAAVRALRGDNGNEGLWLAGAWMGSGFHEDGLKSGLEAALSLGGRVPWSAQGVATRPVAETSNARPALARRGLL
ncbi:MAG: FAD-dependent oxidoreductase, partial [Pseudomonadota bacterium]